LIDSIKLFFIILQGRMPAPKVYRLKEQHAMSGLLMLATERSMVNQKNSGWSEHNWNLTH